MKLTRQGAEYFAGFDPQRVFGSFERPRWAKNAQTGKMEQQLPGKTTLGERFYGIEGGEVWARFEQGSSPRSWPGGRPPPPTSGSARSRRPPTCYGSPPGRPVAICSAMPTRSSMLTGAFWRSMPLRPERGVRLRRPADVVEVFSGQVLGQQVLSFSDVVRAPTGPGSITSASWDAGHRHDVRPSDLT